MAIYQHKDDTTKEKKIEITCKSTKTKQSENAHLYLPQFYAEPMKQNKKYNTFIKSVNTESW